jgi:hypothetical protein
VLVWRGKPFAGLNNFRFGKAEAELMIGLGVLGLAGYTLGKTCG